MRLRRGALLICLFLVGMSISGCVAKNVVTKVTRTEGNADTKGVYYALPRTVVVVGVPIKKTAQTPGEFREFLHCFFPGVDPADIITEEKHLFSVGSPTFTPLGEPDPEQVFRVKIHGGFFEDKTLQMDLTEGGVMTKGEATSENKALEFASKALKTFIAIGTQTAGAAAFAAKAQEADKGNEERDCEEGYLSRVQYEKELLPRAFRDRENLQIAREVALSQRDQAEADLEEATASRADVEVNGKPAEIKQANDAVTKRQKDFAQAAAAFQKADQALNQNQRIIANTNSTGLRAAEKRLNDFERAQIVFHKLVALQAKRDQLVSSSEVGFAQDTLTLMLKTLDETIGLYRSQFFGSVVKEDPWTATFNVLPERPSGGGAPQFPKLLFRIATEGTKETNGGICELPPEYQHLQVPNDFRNASGRPCMETRTATLNLTDLASASIASRVSPADTSRDNENGFFYRIPGKALMTLDLTNEQGIRKERGRDTLTIAQFGTLVSLPASTGGRTTRYSLTLYDSSGALKQVTIGSSALIQNSLLEDIQASATSINDLRSARAKAKADAAAAAATASDEVTQLTREATILELKAKIKELEGKLKQPTP